MTTYTQSQIKLFAQYNDMEVATVIPNEYKEVEYLTVKIKRFKTAFFLMDNDTFDYTYSHTYNALNDKTTNRLPKGF